MSEDPEFSKIYEDLSKEDKEWARMIVPRLMEALCNMDDEARSRGDDISFTMEGVHKKSKLGSISLKTFTEFAKQCRKVGEPLFDIDKDGNVTLTDKGRNWCSIHMGG